MESAESRYRRGSDRRAEVTLELVLSSIVLGEPATELKAEMVALLTQKSVEADAPAAAIKQSVLGLRSHGSAQGSYVMERQAEKTPSASSASSL